MSLIFQSRMLLSDLAIRDFWKMSEREVFFLRSEVHS